MLKIEIYMLYKVVTAYADGDTRITNIAVPLPKDADVTYNYTCGSELVRKRIFSSNFPVVSTQITSVGTVEVVTET